MTDVQLHSALERLAPQVDGTPAWHDVIRRAELGTRFRWRLAVVAVAILLTAGVVAGALAAGLLGGSLDRLGAWAGDPPGEPAPEQQASFDRENSLAYAKFPKGTRIGRLVQIEFEGRKYELFGFRDGSNLCLRLVPSPTRRNQNPPECVPTRELRRLGTPIAAVGGHLRARMKDGSGLTMLYGLASDAVSSIEVIEKGRPLGQTAVGNNAFLFAVADQPRFKFGGPPIVLRAWDDREVIADVSLETGPIMPNVDDPTELPGPDEVKPALTSGSVGWLDRGEARGEPFKFPRRGLLGIVESRLLQPDPASSFRIGVARAEVTDQRMRGEWYCLSWFWPLIRGSATSMCGRDDPIETGLFYSASLASSAVQFPLFVGLAADEVVRLELYHRDGSFDVVSIVDNPSPSRRREARRSSSSPTTRRIG